ncbi:MAG: serine/threonine-protein kinase [Planctomycetota bacterium]
MDPESPRDETQKQPDPVPGAVSEPSSESWEVPSKSESEIGKRFNEALKEQFGADLDPGISLDSAPHMQSDSSIRDRIRELAERLPENSRYQLRGEVARGGMGVVLNVWDRDLRRNLAMKAMLMNVRTPDGQDAPLVDMSVVSRFLEEAQITGQLDQPGVVPVPEMGVDPQGRVYFTMRLVKGRELKEIFSLAQEEAEGWSRPRALAVLHRVCETMAYAHSKGVIHRDLKPSNIMVGKFGETYVMDWGLAKVVGRDDRPPSHDHLANQTIVNTDRIEDLERAPASALQTMDGTVLGTPAFMAPEQAMGRIAELDGRADVYSVGALLYTLLTGNMPYIEEVAGTAMPSATAVLTLAIAGPPKSISEMDCDAPAELVAICEKAMERRPTDRYETMMEMAEDVRAFLEGRVVRAYQTGAWAEFRKWVRRNRGMAAALACVLLVLLGSAAVFSLQQRRRLQEVQTAQAETEQARDLAQDNEKRALANEEKALGLEQQAEQRSYLANLAAAASSLRLLEALEAKQRLDACSENMRGWEWNHLYFRADTSMATLDAHQGRVTALAFAPDGKRVATGSEDNRIRIYEVGEDTALFDIPTPLPKVSMLAFSPDGSVLAAALDHQIYLFDAQTGNPRGALTGHERAVTGLAFQADGTVLVSSSTDKTLRFWDSSRMSELKRIEVKLPVRALALSADGKTVAAGTEGSVALFNAESGEPLDALAESEGDVVALAFAPDGAHLAAAFQVRAPAVWRLPDFEYVGTLEGHADPVSSLAFTADGAGLVTASYDTSLRVWDSATLESRSVLIGHDAAVRAVATDPLAQYIVSGASNGRVRFWAAEGHTALRSIALGESAGAGLAFLKDGRRVAVSAPDEGWIKLFDAGDGASRSVIESEEAYFVAIAANADGSRLAVGSEEEATVLLIDVRSGETLQTLEGHQLSVAALAFVGDTNQLVTGSQDHEVRLWNGSGKTVLKMLGHEEPVTSVAVSNDGRLVVSGSLDRTARVWDLKTGEVVAVLKGHEDRVLAVAISPNGARVATASADATVRVWSVEDGKCVHVLAEHAGPVTCLAFHPAGGRLVSGGRDKTVRFWNPETGDQVLRLSAHNHWVTALAFSPDGARLATISEDQTLKIWAQR